MKKQIVVIHGGDTWETYEEYLKYLKSREIDFDRHGLRKSYWEDKLNDRLGKDFQVVRPEMPSKRNAKYLEWKNWFEKFIPFLEPEIVLIGGSLGGIFVAKYLAENDFPKKLKAVFLLASPFGDNPPDYKLLDFSLPKNLDKLQSQAKKIFLYQSKDDVIVPPGDVKKYKEALPNATVRMFEDRGHFILEEFPELIEDIKNLYKKRYGVK